MTAALEAGEWSAARPGRTLPRGKTRYPFYRRLGGSQVRSGRAEILASTGIRSRTVEPVVSRYTDWATRSTNNRYVETGCYGRMIWDSLKKWKLGNRSSDGTLDTSSASEWWRQISQNLQFWLPKTDRGPMKLQPKSGHTYNTPSSTVYTSHYPILYTYIKLGSSETFCDSFEQIIRRSRKDLQTMQFNEQIITLPILIGGLTKMVVIRCNTTAHSAM